MENWQIFLMGLWIGVTIGIFIMALVCLAKENKNERNQNG